MGRRLALFSLTILTALSTSCEPPTVDTLPGDNTFCHFEGYEEISVAGRLRIGFAFEGGEVEVSGGELPALLLCDVRPDS